LSELSFFVDLDASYLDALRAIRRNEPCFAHRCGRSGGPCDRSVTRKWCNETETIRRDHQELDDEILTPFRPAHGRRRSRHRRARRRRPARGESPGGNARASCDTRSRGDARQRRGDPGAGGIRHGHAPDGGRLGRARRPAGRRARGNLVFDRGYGYADLEARARPSGRITAFGSPASPKRSPPSARSGWSTPASFSSAIRSFRCSTRKPMNRTRRSQRVTAPAAPKLPLRGQRQGPSAGFVAAPRRWISRYTVGRETLNSTASSARDRSALLARLERSPLAPRANSSHGLREGLGQVPT
jgi:hypothetical protein